MLHCYTNQFLEYCRLVDFSIRSTQTLTTRLNELENFLKTHRIRFVKRLRYHHLINFTADYNAPSIHVTKSRVWTLRQFYHFLTLHRIVAENIATALPYPKIEKTVPQFLTQADYRRLIRHFTDRADSPMGLRNLIVIMLLGTLGLRTSTLTALNIEDIDLSCGLVWLKEKGQRQRNLVVPHSLCKIIHEHLQLFKNFVRTQNLKTIDGPTMIDFQYYLKEQRNNCGASINRKIFTLRSYGNFLKLYDNPCAVAPPFYDVLKIRQGYRKRPNALTPRKISLLFKAFDTDTIIGIRDYAVYAMMYQLKFTLSKIVQT